MTGENVEIRCCKGTWRGEAGTFSRRHANVERTRRRRTWVVPHGKVNVAVLVQAAGPVVVLDTGDAGASAHREGARAKLGRRGRSEKAAAFDARRWGDEPSSSMVTSDALSQREKLNFSLERTLASASSSPTKRGC